MDKFTTPIWLDDDHEPPSDRWIWVKTFRQFNVLYATHAPTAISFDHYLGDVGSLITGNFCLEDCIYTAHIVENGFLDNCRLMNFHSSDESMRELMEQTAINSKAEGLLPMDVITLQISKANAVIINTFVEEISR